MKPELSWEQEQDLRDLMDWLDEESELEIEELSEELERLWKEGING